MRTPVANGAGHAAVRKLQDGLRRHQLVAPQQRGRPPHHMPVEPVLDDYRARPPVVLVAGQGDTDSATGPEAADGGAS